MTKYEIIKSARAAEHKGNWKRAAELWKLAGRTDDAMTCEEIAKFVEKGDAFRKEVAETLGPAPEERSPLNEQWVNWFTEMHKIYDKHFNS